MSKEDPFKFLTTISLGWIIVDVIQHATEFAVFAHSILEAIMMAKKYIVHIGMNDEPWGHYTIIAANRTSAAFIAGMKFQREERADPGDWIVCEVVVPPTD